jgi:glycolate oxidase FAD binding subunit
MKEPKCSEELAEVLAECSARDQTVQLSGAATKQGMAGPIETADISVTTTGMTRVLQYEPADLTISVEAGLRWADLTAMLAGNGQMIPLDPPFASAATVGGVVAANTSGPRRRLYGSARDVIIGMKFATLNGKLVQSGGMVVKNVAGLDMAKLMIGSFGTLAAIAVVNFKLAPIPPASRTFILSYATLDEAMSTRKRVLESVLQPSAIDVVNKQAARRLGLDGFCVMMQVGGSEAVLERYNRELAGADVREGDNFWTNVQEFTPGWLRDYPQGGVARVSTTLSGVHGVLALAEGPALARAGNGVVYLYFEDGTKATVGTNRGAIEFAPAMAKRNLELWPNPGNDFAVMHKIKQLFDPKSLLNRGRLYGRI